MTAVAPSAPTEGRAARRRAAQEAAKRARRRGGGRRRRRPASGGPVVALSRLAGELFITLGVVMLLFVAYQLWYTNVLAERTANGAGGGGRPDRGGGPARGPPPPRAA
ncbi:class E sortase, partial [Streptomyces vinaceus]